MNAIFRNLTTRQLIVVGLIVPLLCTVIVGILQWHAVSDMLRGRIMGRQFRDTQVALGVFRYSLSDAESSQFRYILTHEPADLGLYRKLIGQANDQFAKLRQLTAGNDSQQKYLDQIEPLLKSKQAAAEQGFALEQGGNHAAALQMISSDASRQNMLDIEAAVESLQSISAELVLERQNASLQTLELTGGVSVAGLTLNLVCIATILLLIRRLEHAQSAVTLDAMKEMIRYQEGSMTIEEYLRRRAEALVTHGHAQIEAEKLLSQIERLKGRNATQRVRTVGAPPL